MALTETLRARLTAYCRLDELTAEEDCLLETLYEAAVSYMEQAGVSEPPEDSDRRAQYNLCVNSLVLDAWDVRGTAVTGTIAENPAFRRSLNQLKLTEPEEVL